MVGSTCFGCAQHTGFDSACLARLNTHFFWVGTPLSLSVICLTHAEEIHTIDGDMNVLSIANGIMKTNWLWTIALGGVISSTCGSAIAFFPAVAQAASHTAQTGNVKATLSYELDKSSEAKDLRLRIERQGKILFDQVPSPALPQEEGIISGGKPLTYEQNPLKVRDLDRDREPDVFFDMFTGGAHCCVYTVFYRYNPQQQRYDASTHFWGDLGYRLQDLNQDGQMEFVSGDPRFAMPLPALPVPVSRFRFGTIVKGRWWT